MKQFGPIHIMSTLLFVTLISLIYVYINDIHNGCTCNVVDKFKTDSLKKVLIGIVLYNLFFPYFMTNINSTVAITIIFAVSVTIFSIYIYVVKYIFDIEKKCECSHIRPIMKDVIKVWLIILLGGFAINIVGLLVFMMTINGSKLKGNVLKKVSFKKRSSIKGKRSGKKGKSKK
jgi:hypothetical protein